MAKSKFEEPFGYTRKGFKKPDKDLCDFCSKRKEGCIEVKIDDVDEDKQVFTETYLLCPDCNPEMLN